MHCNTCDRTFSNKQSLAQHLQNSPKHTQAFLCKPCNRIFKSEEAFDQHLQDSPAHAICFPCKTCNRDFNSEEALEQHERDSPAHANVFPCESCNRSFRSEEALQQHFQNSPAHLEHHTCKPCERTFNSAEALQQHLRDSPAHNRSITTTSSETSVLSASRSFVPQGKADRYSMYPALHEDVSRELEEENIYCGFNKTDGDDNCVKEHNTNIMGRFICFNAACKSDGWSSKVIAVTIRMYTGMRYNARVYHQRCRSCNHLSRPYLNSAVYAERVSYRIKKWEGVDLPLPYYSGESQGPHQSKLCEGCREGHCAYSRRSFF